PFHVTQDGETVTDFESSKVRALLAFLVVEADRPHSRDELATLLWPEQPERAARRNLSQALFNLRHVICDDEAASPVLHVTRGAVQFVPHAGCVLDVSTFSAHIAAAEAHPDCRSKPCDACLQHLEAAAGLYRGDFLTGFYVDTATFSEWAMLLRERLHYQALDTLFRLTEHHERRRDYLQARGYAQRQVELEPWREEAHQQLMRLFIRTGQRSAALQQYQTCAEILEAELGVEPTETTRHLYRRIKTAARAGVHNLPTPVTPFVGRHELLREIGERLVDPACRLLTLVGPGGVGKTRLALETSFENRRAFLHGVCFVSLADVNSAELLPAALSKALDLTPHTNNPRSLLLDTLRSREMLLVLDNFEHLLTEDPSVDLVAEIMRTAPEVTVLATSRERLNIYGEIVFHLEGMKSATAARDSKRGEAVTLFLQCAGRQRDDFAPTEADMQEVIRICRAVDGNPLGIELAAGWVERLSCTEIAAQIEESLTLLSTRMRGIPARHRSVRAAFDYSWRRLTRTEQETFARLSVFRGGFDREAARVVTGATPQLLATLAGRSFLQPSGPDHYRFHALLRQYGAEKLATTPSSQTRQTRDLHSRYYMGIMQDNQARFKAGQQRASLDRAEQDIENIRTAWKWSVENQYFDLLEMAMPFLYIYCYGRSRFQEGYALFYEAVAAVDARLAATPQPATSLMGLLGSLLWRQADLLREFQVVDTNVTPSQLLDRSVTLLRSCGHPAELTKALEIQGLYLHQQGQHEPARAALEESVALGRRLEDPTNLAWALTGLGTVMCRMHELTIAADVLQEGLALHRSLDNWVGIAYTINNLGILTYFTGDFEQAKRLFLESKEIHDNLGNPGLAAMMISNAAHVEFELGNHEAALHHFGEALDIATKSHPSRQLMDVFDGLAAVMQAREEAPLAYTLAAFTVHHMQPSDTTKQGSKYVMTDLEKQLPAEMTARIRAQVRRWTLDDIVAEVLTYTAQQAPPSEALL
ncbi:MAG: tetratricopeptide repeat protein, partial [Anaerolineae bacterium]|nr:tetratricopeptide repeat protein [Anaerolineae bacterium]